MKKISYLASSCVFAICASFALAAPLYACGESTAGAEQAASAVSKKESTAATSHGQTALRQTKQKVKQKGKQIAAPEKPQVKVTNVDFKVLKERLKDTDAIGFFTKLAIRNDIVDLMDKIKKYRKHAMLNAKMKEIRRSFDGLLLKIIALLKDDPKLSRDLYVGRESIWASLLEVKA